MDQIPDEYKPNIKDRDECDKVVVCLASLGTNYLLSNYKLRDVMAGLVAHTALYLEARSSEDSPDGNRLDFFAKERDLWHDPEREATIIFHKQNDCNRLKGKYQQAKTLTKLGNCRSCHQSFKRKQLLLCTRCKILQYCSAECQRADWPSHKDWCNQNRAT